MEFILLLIVGSVIYSAVENYFKNNNSKSKADGYLEKIILIILMQNLASPMTL